MSLSNMSILVFFSSEPNRRRWDSRYTLIQKKLGIIMVFLLHDGDLLVDLLLFSTAGVLVTAASLPFGHPAESFRDCTALLSIFFISTQIIFDKFIFIFQMLPINNK